MVILTGTFASYAMPTCVIAASTSIHPASWLAFTQRFRRSFMCTRVADLESDDTLNVVTYGLIVITRRVVVFCAI